MAMEDADACGTHRVIARGLALALLTLRAAAGSEYHVSTTGDDEGPGTRARPFRTIQRAADELRAGDTCFVAGGVYHETVRLSSSGTEGRPIRLCAAVMPGPQSSARSGAAPGGIPVISGTIRIEGVWTRHRGGIYRTRLREPVSQLFVDGEPMTAARWPDMPFERRWDKSAWAVAGEGSSHGRMVDPELGKTGIDWTGAVATLNVGSYQTFRREVRRHAAGGDSFTYDPPDKEYMKKHKRRWAGFDRYFVSGKLDALDAPGEWFLDADTLSLYVWLPDGGSPEGRNRVASGSSAEATRRGIEGKARGYGLIVKDAEHVEISGLHFFATTLKLENVRSCVVDGVHLTFPTCVKWPFRAHGPDDADTAEEPRRWPARRWFGETSIVTPTFVSGEDNMIRNSSVRFCMGPAITLVGSRNVIENCLMHDVDWYGLDYGYGVDMLGSPESTIRNCTVFNVGGSEGVRLANHGASVVEYNYLHHGGLAQSDGAMVQAATPGVAGTVVRYNWVHDHNAFNWGGAGIRGDDRTRGLIVHHNVVWSSRHKGIVVKGDRNRVYNNTCLANPEIDILVPKRPLPAKTKELKVQNANSETINNCARNISGRYAWERKTEPPLGELAHNYTGGAPMLVDAAGHDFRPRAGSPLIDTGRVIPGVTDGFRGDAPDIGAYEFGGERWAPGCRNGLRVSASEAGGGVELLVALRMPPFESVRLEASRAGVWVADLEFRSDDWATPGRMVLPAGGGSVLFRDAHLGSVELDAVPPPGSVRDVWFERPMLATSGASLPAE